MRYLLDNTGVHAALRIINNDNITSMDNQDFSSLLVLLSLADSIHISGFETEEVTSKTLELQQFFDNFGYRQVIIENFSNQDILKICERAGDIIKSNIHDIPLLPISDNLLNNVVPELSKNTIKHSLENLHKLLIGDIDKIQLEELSDNSFSRYSAGVQTFIIVNNPTISEYIIRNNSNWSINHTYAFSAFMRTVINTEMAKLLEEKYYNIKNIDKIPFNYSSASARSLLLTTQRKIYIDKKLHELINYSMNKINDIRNVNVINHFNLIKGTKDISLSAISEYINNKKFKDPASMCEEAIDIHNKADKLRIQYNKMHNKMLSMNERDSYEYIDGEFNYYKKELDKRLNIIGNQSDVVSRFPVLIKHILNRDFGDLSEEIIDILDVLPIFNQSPTVSILKTAKLLAYS